MKNIRTILFIFLMVTISCCNRDRVGDFYHFPKTIEMNDGVKIELDIPITGGFFATTKSYIIVNQLRATKRYFHLIDKKKLRYIGSYGIIGRGPGEIGRGGGLMVDEIQNCIWVNDFGKKLIWQFPLDSMNNNKDFKPNIQYPLIFDPRLDFYRSLSHNSLFYYNTFNDSLYAKYDPKTNELSFHGDKAFYKNKIIKENAVPPVMATEICFNHELGKLAVSFKHYDIISILDNKNKPQYILRGNDRITQKDPTKLDPFKTIQAYSSIKNGGGNFYAAYCGKQIMEGNPVNYKQNGTKEIHVFDWEGNPKIKYIFKNEFIDFLFDDENKRLIVFDAIEGMVYYDIEED